jgi:sensor histidine kinase YesM
MKDQIYIRLEQLPIEWKTLLHIWFWTALITGIISNVTFILIQTDPNVIINSPMMTQKELNPMDALSGFGISAIYTTIFMASSLTVAYMVCRWYPWFNLRHLLLQISVLSPVFLIAYIIAGEICIFLDADIELYDQLSITIVGLISLSATVIITLIIYMIVFIRQMHSLQADIAKANLQVLQSQVNPHFLFNTLNTIAALIRFQPQKAEVITEDLSDLFRSALNVSEKQIVS